MKKFCSALFVCLTAVMLRAAIPGETPGTPAHQLNWVDCSPMPMGKLDPEIHKGIPQWRTVTFMLTRARDTDSTIAMLENIRRQYQGKVLNCIITPDNISDADALRKRFPNMRLRLAVDTTRKLTPEYMNNTIMLFPMSFIMDKNGMICWRGETVDLPEAMEKLLQNKLPLDIQKKISPMVYTMQQHLKDGNLPKALVSAKQLLAVDPGNPSALRLAVFAAESTASPKEAWLITENELKKSPDTPRIYFTALDLIMRHTECRQFLGKICTEFARQPFAPAIRCTFADILLNSFPFEIDAVLGAKNILAATPMPLSAIPEQMAHLLAVRARLHYALGDVKAAESDLAEAVQYLKTTDSQTQLLQTQKQLDFFRAVLKHLEQEKR